MIRPMLTDEQFSLVRSIIYDCPALKMPQTFLQRLGATAQIVPLKGLTQEQAQSIVDRLNAASPTAPPDTLKQALEALEVAHNGLKWYRDRCPEAVDESDGEADEQIDAAIASLQASLAAPPDTTGRVEVGAKPAGRVLPNPGSPEASAMLDSMLAEYQWPANSKNAARAGWEAANRWLGQKAAPAHSKSEYKRRVAQGDLNVLPPTDGVPTPSPDQGENHG